MQRHMVKKVQKLSAVQQALENLRAYIYEADARGERRLPSEEELAQQLGISRMTVREVLAVLERDGVIARSQGKGTVINSFVRQLKSRIDTSREIDTFLLDNGYQISSRVLDFTWRRAEKEEADKLGISEGEEILVVKKVFMADAITAAFYVDRTPRSLFKHENFSEQDLEKSMFAFIENICEQQITHDVLEIIPAVADKNLSRIFNVPILTPLLRLDVLEYGEKGMPLMYNSEYYTDKFIRFTLCRNVAFMS